MNKRFFHPKSSTTILLEQVAESCETFEEFETKAKSEFFDDYRICDYLFDLLIQYNKKASLVSNDAMLSPSYVGNIVNRKRNNPSRNAVLSIALTIGATIEETENLLKYAGHSPLYARRKRDVIIWFGLIHHQSLDDVNEQLVNRKMQPLYK